MGGFFAGQGLLINGIVHLAPREVLAAVERGAVLVDLREEYELAMKTFDVPGVLFLASSALEGAFEQLPLDRPLILADSVGLRSRAAVAFLQARGCGDVANLNGGILDWESAGLPTKVDPDGLWRGQCACQLRPRKARRR